MLGAGDHELDPSPLAATSDAEKRLERPDAGQAVDPLRPARRAVVQAERRTRPFARREASTLRPPTVLILARKPCFRARRILLGWKVRFMAVAGL
jgi:hypothetical protein